MKRALTGLLIAMATASGVGCAAGHSMQGGNENAAAACDDCNVDDDSVHPRLRGVKRYMEDGDADSGPATAAVAYPYYTHKAPRDFLNGNPASIGR